MRAAPPILALATATLLAAGVAAPAVAQGTRPSPVDPDAPSLLSEVPSVPGLAARLRGLNAGITLTGVHDSSTGYYTLMTPAASFSFHGRYSVDASMPVYLYRLAETTVATTTTNPAQPTQPVSSTYATALQTRTWDSGDMVLAAHANVTASHLQNVFTTSMTVPTGDSDRGLSTGRVTFDLDSHTQVNAGRGSLLIDLGGGDSSTLVNRLVTRDYTSLGPLAHFQAGLLVPLPLPALQRASFQSVAYEQLPLGNNRVDTTLTRRGYPDRTVISGRSVSEDNGFTNSLALTLTPHLTLQGYYNRSLRLHLDTGAVSLTWVWRGYRPAKAPSLLGSLLAK